MTQTETDLAMMTRALQLGEAARIFAHPNPWVGAVLVVGAHSFEGATEPDGGRHAEAVVLDHAPQDLSGATLYVTLEPCWPFPNKRTASCAERLVERGIRRVVVAMEDPDMRVRGRGIRALRDAGVSVQTVCAPSNDRPTVRRVENGHFAGWPHSRTRRFKSMDHQRSCATRCASVAGRK
jgi:pyrimidine deaminase RibD-like protein